MPHSLPSSPRAPRAASAQALTDRVLERGRLAAIRRARAALLDAACRNDAAAIEAAVPHFVHVMWEAEFSRQTICSLVAAAIDAGLPMGRGAARRAQRTRTIDHWMGVAERLADTLPVRR